MEDKLRTIFFFVQGQYLNDFSKTVAICTE